MIDPIAAHLAAVRRDRYGDATLTARARLMSITILRGNALALPLADESVDLVVTSPPYFGLRSYQDGGEHYDGQIGSEATPAEFVDALIAATREMVRVIKPSGSIWVNLGDKMSSGVQSGDMELRHDLTDEERAYVFAELAKCALL